MKRLILSVLLLISVSSSVSAESLLDETRWKWLFSTDAYGCYYDMNTANIISESTFEAWICNYYPGNTSCRFQPCVEAGLSDTEHYHYSKAEFDSEQYTSTLKGHVIRDNNGAIIYSFTIPSDNLKPATITPGSVGEDMLIKIKEDLYQYK